MDVRLFRYWLGKYYTRPGAAGSFYCRRCIPGIHEECAVIDRAYSVFVVCLSGREQTLAFGGANPQQLVQRQRQFANADAGGMKYRVRNSRARAHDPDLTHPFDTERVDNRVLLLEKDYFDCVHI